MSFIKSRKGPYSETVSPALQGAPLRQEVSALSCLQLCGRGQEGWGAWDTHPGACGGGRYSRGVCREAHSQEGVQERGGAAALVLVGDLGVELSLPRCHLFLPVDRNE